MHLLGRFIFWPVMMVMLARAPLVQAQPEQSMCSGQARHALSEVGEWAELQCSAGRSLAFTAVSMQRCSDTVIQDLQRVGNWTEAQCQPSGADEHEIQHAALATDSQSATPLMDDQTPDYPGRREAAFALAGRYQPAESPPPSLTELPPTRDDWFDDPGATGPRVVQP
jgi:hypothetical protein